MESSSSTTCSNDLVVAEFLSLIAQNMAIPVCAMNALIGVIRRSSATTWMHLEHDLRSAISHLKASDWSSSLGGGRTDISLTSGCDLFMVYVTRAFLELSDFTLCRNDVLKRAETFAHLSLEARNTIASLGHSFIQNDFTVFVYGNSRVVNAVILKAAETKHFKVIVAEGKPHSDGWAEKENLIYYKIIYSTYFSSM